MAHGQVRRQRQRLSCRPHRRAVGAAGAALPVVSLRLLFRPVPCFGFEDQLPQIAHPLRIKDAVEMVEFVLYDAGMKSPRGARDMAAFMIYAAIADMGRPRDETPQARNRETALPAALHCIAQDLDLGVDQ